MSWHYSAFVRHHVRPSFDHAAVLTTNRQLHLTTSVVRADRIQPGGLPNTLWGIAVLIVSRYGAGLFDVSDVCQNKATQ